MTEIRFGTDGWRAIMCEEFTFPNARRVTEAICAYLAASGRASQGLVVGYDTRFFSDQFALQAALVAARHGIPAALTRQDAPTPVVAYAVHERQAAGAIMFTASHNPAAYNGLKFIPHYAGPALPDVTNAIESALAKIPADAQIAQLPEAVAREQGLVTTFDPAPSYLKRLETLVDLEAIHKAKLRIVYDPLYGTGRNYVPQVLGPVTDLSMIHGEADPRFGGITPEPMGATLGDLVEAVTGKAHLGLATDGDADRFGVVDFDGTYITANQVLALVLVHLITRRGMKGPVARSVATTHLLDRIAAAHGLPCMEFPVGFKYIGEALREQGVILGGEESGGLSIGPHIPEKDGILAVSLVTEIRAVEGKSLSVLLKQITKKYGAAFSRRLDLHVTNEAKTSVLAGLTKNPPATVAGRAVIGQRTDDGVKLLLEGGAWLLVRPSGTEPLVRVYCEAESQKELDALAVAGEGLFAASPKAVGAGVIGAK